MRSAAVLFALVALVTIGACSTTPDEPAFDNPFDPDGTAPGTGYGLEVAIAERTIVMTWDNLDGVYSYRVEWSDDLVTWLDVPDPEDGDVRPPVTGPKVQYQHETFTAESTNWYRITGNVELVDGDGDVSGGPAMLTSNPVALDISVMVGPAAGSAVTATRFIELELLTGTADGVEVSNRRSFADPEVFAVTPGVPSTVAWELATTVWEDGALRDVVNNDDLWVHFRTRTDTSVGMQDSSRVKVLFSPVIEVESGLRPAPGGNFMVDVDQVFRIAPEPGQTVVSVVRNRRGSGNGDWVFVEDLTPASVDDPIAVYWDPAVEEFVDGQLLATLRCDFGFEDDAALELLIPDELGDPAIEIVGGPHTTTRNIRVAATSANAGRVLLSERADFAGAIWVAFADTLDHELDDVVGSRFLYAAFSNPILAETKVTSTLVSLVSPPARVRR